MSEQQMAYDAASIAAIAEPRKEQMLLKLTARDGDPDLFVVLPARAVAPLMIELRSELSKMPIDVRGDAAMPMKLTGALPAWSPDGKPLLLLQVDQSFEIAVLVDSKNLPQLERAVQLLRAGPPAAPSKPQ